MAVSALLLLTEDAGDGVSRLVALSLKGVVGQPGLNQQVPCGGLPRGAAQMFRIYH